MALLLQRTTSRGFGDRRERGAFASQAGGAGIGEEVRIRPARGDEAAELTALVLRPKAHVTATHRGVEELSTDPAFCAALGLAFCRTTATTSTTAATSSDSSTVLRPSCSVSVSM